MFEGARGTKARPDERRETTRGASTRAALQPAKCQAPRAWRAGRQSVTLQPILATHVLVRGVWVDPRSSGSGSWAVSASASARSEGVLVRQADGQRARKPIPLPCRGRPPCAAGAARRSKPAGTRRQVRAQARESRTCIRAQFIAREKRPSHLICWGWGGGSAKAQRASAPCVEQEGQGGLGHALTWRGRRLPPARQAWERQHSIKPNRCDRRPAATSACGAAWAAQVRALSVGGAMGHQIASTAQNSTLQHGAHRRAARHATRRGAGAHRKDCAIHARRGGDQQP